MNYFSFKRKKSLFDFLNLIIIFNRIVKLCHVVLGADCLDWVVVTVTQIGSCGVQVLIEN